MFFFIAQLPPRRVPGRAGGVGRGIVTVLYNALMGSGAHIFGFGRRGVGIDAWLGMTMTMTMTMIKMMRAIKTTMMKEMQTEKQSHHHSRADRVESLHPTHDRRIPPLC
jgi:hypothetical protein